MTETPELELLPPACPPLAPPPAVPGAVQDWTRLVPTWFWALSALAALTSVVGLVAIIWVVSVIHSIRAPSTRRRLQDTETAATLQDLRLRVKLDAEA